MYTCYDINSLIAKYRERYDAKLKSLTPPVSKLFKPITACLNTGRQSVALQRQAVRACGCL